MEPIISKLQEGVKYPRFERDATKTINDLVDHITKERGIYSSSIEPNPSEHNIWFNTNDNTLYIYNKGVWKTISDNDTNIFNEPFIFYCSDGTLYYTGNNVNNGDNGIGISGFYNYDRLIYVIESSERKTIHDISLSNVYIEPSDDATIIIGEYNFFTNIAILGIDLNNPHIYMYNNTLHIGNSGDSFSDNINLYNADVFCNCKHIGNITVSHAYSTLDLYISSINFIVGNNNTLTITQDVSPYINDCYIYVIKETDNDKSKVSLAITMNGGIQEYVNLCGTSLNDANATNILCYTFITTSIDDIDKGYSNHINMSNCEILIIDAPYRKFNNYGYIYYLKGCNYLKIYVTDIQLFNFLKSQGLTPIMAVANNSYYDDKVIVNYKTSDGADIYNKTIYKR